MTFATIVCPTCGTRITVSGNAPPRLRCPKCFGVVERPEAREAQVPVPVIPLDRQVTSDSTAVRTMLIVAAIFIVLGLAFVLIANGVRGSGGFLVLSLVIAGVLGYLLTTSAASPRGAGLVATPSIAGTGMAGGTLTYWTPTKGSFEEGQYQLSAALGCVAAAAFGFVGFWGVVLAIAQFSQGNRSGGILIALLLAAIPIALIYFSFRRGYRGFAIGFLSGILMAVLALGFCFVLIAGVSIL